ncbi:MAG: ABC transporter substrate-binding protein [Paracoccaceae bacterium]|nr:MAG: ABC transporter substrate-binding protein [Paracoccaceae bacterium]
MLTRRTFATTFAALATATALGAGAVAAQDMTKVTFVQPSPSAINSFNVFVAIGEGYFAEEGLDVTVEAINGSGAVLQALSSGQAQFGRPGPGPVLAARGRGVDVVFIYNFAARSNFGVVVPSDSPVQAPADLKGKVVGTGTADGAEVGFARNVLSGSGMTEGTDYTFLTVGDGGPATAAFQQNAIAAYAASTADAAILNQRGVSVRDITPAEYARFFGNGFITTGELIRTNPELVEKFVRAIWRGHVFALDDANRDKVLAHMVAGNPQESEDPAFASALFDAVRSKTVPVDMSKGLGYQPPEVWEEWQQVQIAGGDLAGPLPDLTAAYTNDFTLKVNGSN